MRFLSIDLETTGLNYDQCQILEIGAVVGDLTSAPVDTLPSFHRFIRHDKVIGEPFALAMNADILRIIADKNRTDVVTPDRAVIELQKFVLGHFGVGTRPTVAGKNYASFDKNFLERLPGWDSRAFKHRSLDPAILFWEPEHDTELPSTKQCMERAGLDPSVKHRAVEDAMSVVELIRRGIGR